MGGWPRVAFLISLGFTAFLRPIDFFQARRRHLILPSDVLGTGGSLWLRIMDPKSGMRQARHQIARCDEDWVIRIAEALYAAAPKESFLWPASRGMFAKRWKAIGEYLDIPTEMGRGVSPASLRPGGVTSYYLATEDLARLIRRARWTDASQLQIYIQEVTPLEFLAQMSATKRDRLRRIASTLPYCVELAIDLLQAKVPLDFWYDEFLKLERRFLR